MSLPQGHSHDDEFLGRLQEWGELHLAFDVQGGQYVGDEYVSLARKISKVVEHQWKADSRRGPVPGFLLTGPPGVGKTTLAKRVGYELCMRFPSSSTDGGVATLLADTAEIARARYGESEKRIRELFRTTQGTSSVSPRVVLILDDVDSILLSRTSPHVKEWHFSQAGVFFHAVDELDTTRATVILTSNRPDMLDEALLDRFVEFKIDYPDVEVLVAAAARRIAGSGLEREQVEEMGDALAKAAADGGVRSLRDAEHFAIRHYLDSISDPD